MTHKSAAETEEKLIDVVDWFQKEREKEEEGTSEKIGENLGIKLRSWRGWRSENQVVTKRNLLKKKDFEVVKKRKNMQ